MEEIIKLTLESGSEVGRWLNRVMLWWTVVFGSWLVLLCMAFAIEWLCGIVVGRRAVAWRQSHTTGSAADDAGQLADVLGRGIPGFTMLRRRLRHVADLRYSVGTVASDLAAVDAESVEARLAIPKFASGVPVMFGLLGTLAGLTAAIVQIQPLLTGVKNIDDLPQLLGAMVGTLGGMRTAFGASIGGLVATLLLSSLATIASWFAARALVRIDRTTAQGFVPMLAVSEWQLAATKFSEALTKNTELVSNITGSMGEWSGKISEALEQVRASEEDLGVAAGSIREGAQMMVGRQDTFLSEVSQLNATLHGMRGALDGVSAALGQVPTRVESGEDRKVFIQQLNHVQAAVAQIVEKVDRISQGNPKLFADALEGAKQTSAKDLVEFFDSVEDKLAQHVIEMSSSTKGLLTALEGNHNAMRAVFGAMQSGQARGPALGRNVPST